MTNITYKNAGKQAFLGVVRELVTTYQAFTHVDAAGLRLFGLTPSQADVLFTLGNQTGMTFKEIGQKTLITKGTLTGVIDRLQAKSLVKRITGRNDRRCIRVELTAKGNKLFQTAFPVHIIYLKEHFDRMSGEDQATLRVLLKRLTSLF